MESLGRETRPREASAQEPGVGSSNGISGDATSGAHGGSMMNSLLVKQPYYYFKTIFIFINISSPTWFYFTPRTYNMFPRPT